jgi:hypothetical protein
MEVNYHLLDECPRRHRPEADVTSRQKEQFTVPSESQPGVVYTVDVSERGHLVCNCSAGSYGRWCKHKEEVRRLLCERGAEAVLR